MTSRERRALYGMIAKSRLAIRDSMEWLAVHDESDRDYRSRLEEARLSIVQAGALEAFLSGTDHVVVLDGNGMGMAVDGEHMLYGDLKSDWESCDLFGSRAWHRDESRESERGSKETGK